MGISERFFRYVFYFIFLLCLAVSAHSMAIGIPTSTDRGSHTPFPNSRAPSVISESVHLTDKLGTTERNDDSGAKCPMVPPTICP